MQPTDFERVVTWLPPVDRATLDEQAASAARELFARTGDFDTDAKRVREALKALTDTVFEMRGRRDRAAVALSRYWVLRRGTNLPEAMGVSRAAWSAIRKRYEEQPVRDYRSAPALLTKYAALAYHAETVVHCGREVRDALAQEMADSGMTNTQIAVRVGLSQSQVSRQVRWQPKRAGVRRSGR